MHGLAREGLIFFAVARSIVSGKVRDYGKGVGVDLGAHVAVDKLFCFFDCGSLRPSVLERPCDVGSDAKDVGVVAVRGALINELRVGLPTSIRLLLRREPLFRSCDQSCVYVINLRHVAELH